MSGVFSSLRWRIAAGYAALLIVAIAIAGIVVTLRFQAILYDQARQRVDNTITEMVTAATPQNSPFAFNALSGNPEQVLINGANIAAWSSPTIFIQISTPSGYPEAKSSNLGSDTFPKNGAIEAAHPSAFRIVTIAAGPFVVEDRYLRVSSSGRAVIISVGEPLDALNRAFEQTRVAIVVILTVAGVLVIAFSFALASQVTRPIAELAGTMREIGSEHLDRRVSFARQADEIRALAQSFNALLERLQEAFARERRFISDASHELKTPLTSINANAQMLMRWGDKDETIRTESLATIAQESATLANMVSGMLTLAKADRGDAVPKEPLSLASVAAQAVKASAPRAAEKGLTLTFEPAAGSTVVYGDANLVRQLIGNLVENAIKFTPSGGVTVRAGSDETHAWVDVEDTGPGIPEDELAFVFERFYRADKAHSRTIPGTGLGLAIVRSIARVHDASVVAGRAAGGGALFRATFARADLNLTELS